MHWWRPATTKIEEGILLSSIGNTEATGRLFYADGGDRGGSASQLAGREGRQPHPRVVRALSQTRADCDVVLVSKDINMRVKARALGLSAEDYTNDKVLEDTDVLYTGVLALPDNFWDRHSRPWSPGSKAAPPTLPTASPGPLVPDAADQRIRVSGGGNTAFYAQVKEIRAKTACAARAARLPACEERRMGASRRATASRVSR